MPSHKEKTSKPGSKLSSWLIFAGILFFLAGLVIFILTFFPVIKEESRYSFKSLLIKKNQPIKPVNEEFGIVIPKIEANAKVIKNVNPFDEKAYQRVLTQGVAHAQGSGLPGHTGNSFIFAHSSGNWYEANQYNSIFYLLHKLEKGDEIDLYYEKQKYIYKVTEKKLVNADEVRYLGDTLKNTSTVTLMTCWPPGTTLKRLIIIAEITNTSQ